MFMLYKFRIFFGESMINNSFQKQTWIFWYLLIFKRTFKKQEEFVIDVEPIP